MAQGDQSKALRIVSKLKGYNCTEFIEDFDVPAGYENRPGTGRFPSDPAQSRDFPNDQREMSAQAPITFQPGQTRDENQTRHTTNANPYAGKNFSAPREPRPPGIGDGGLTFGGGAGGGVGGESGGTQ